MAQKILKLVLLGECLLAVGCLGADYRHSGPALLPNKTQTPGRVDTRVKAQNLQDTVCRANYTAGVRNVSDSTKIDVFLAYDINPANSGHYEVDHLISLELGGSNDIKNLWPQPYAPSPGAREKDLLENYLHRQVCAGKMSLRQAQRALQKDWYKEYKKLEAR